MGLASGPFPALPQLGAQRAPPQVGVDRDGAFKGGGRLGVPPELEQHESLAAQRAVVQGLETKHAVIVCEARVGLPLRRRKGMERGRSEA